MNIKVEYVEKEYRQYCMFSPELEKFYPTDRFIIRDKTPGREYLIMLHKSIPRKSDGAFSIYDEQELGTRISINLADPTRSFFVDIAHVMMMDTNNPYDECVIFVCDGQIGAYFSRG